MSELEEQEISLIIETGLESILSGDSSLEDVLLQHPDKVDMLRPELEMALWLVSAKDQVRPRPGYLQASKKRVLARIKQETTMQAAPRRPLFGFIWSRQMAYRAMAALVVIVLLFFGTNGVVSASMGTIPGDSLYGVKRFSEQVEYTVAPEPAARVELATRNAGRRLDESEKLLSLGRVAEAQNSLHEYQATIQLATAQLQLVSDRQPARKARLASALQATLVRENKQIEAMMASAPASLAESLKAVQTIAAASVTVALDIKDKMETLQAGGTFTPTGPTLTAIYDATQTATVGAPTGSATPTPWLTSSPSYPWDGTVTLAPVVIGSPLPTGTVTLNPVPGANKTPTPTMTPTDHSGRPTKDTKTPHDMPTQSQKDKPDNGKSPGSEDKDNPGKNK